MTNLFVPDPRAVKDVQHGLKISKEPRSPKVHQVLFGGLEHVLFVHILGIIIPTDFHIFQRGRSTTNQSSLVAAHVSVSFGSQREFRPPVAVSDLRSGDSALSQALVSMRSNRCHEAPRLGVVLC